MKTTLTSLTITLVLCASLHRANAQGTAFTYQGRLNDSGQCADGNYDLQFQLWSAPNGGTQVGVNSMTPTSDVLVTNGLFTVLLDFGSTPSNPFNGQQLWLQINVRTNGSLLPYTMLSSRQQITPTPYAIFAENSAGGGGGGGNDWLLTGNGGTVPGVNFLGTTDDEPLELWVNGTRAFRLEPGLGTPNVIGGIGNSVDPTALGGETIGGGQNNTAGASSQNATISGGYENTVSNLYSTISGGEYNKAIANGAVVGGGYQNTASGRESAVAGGAQNGATADGAFIGGGGYDGTTVAGNNAGGPASVVAGGLQNSAFGMYDTVPGGSYNVASGGNSFAAGHQAQALHLGSFVWADSVGGAFQSTAIDQFSVRAEGGVRFVTGGAGMTIDGSPVCTAANPCSGGGGGSGWSLTGNAGTTPGVNFLGTTDGAGLELHVNSLRGIRLDFENVETSPDIYDSSINVLGGSWTNVISAGVVGATIAGGGDTRLDYSDHSVTPYPNTVVDNFGTVGGGYGNTAAYGATVPGGYHNSATGNGSFAAGRNASTSYDGSFVWGDGSAPFNGPAANSFDVLASGGVGFTTGFFSVLANGAMEFVTPIIEITANDGMTIVTDPSANGGVGLSLSGQFMEVTGAGGEEAYLGGNGDGRVYLGSLSSTVTGVYFKNQATGNPMHIDCSSITIEGGSDLAEPFQISAAEFEVPQGAVVVIDEENPGHLKMSDQPYDTRVAGVVSGANGIHPGIQMQQQGLLEGGKNVALTGRVYVQADASNGAIKPGDLLTSSAVPGHAMKVSDHAKAQGAILGKAMTGLKEGRGMVLVLVTLQ